MKTEISRDSHQAEKRYSGVYQQQGRMLTDADWNELTEIVKQRLDDALKDVVGNGTPRERNVEIRAAGNPAGWKIAPGHLYVDGVHAEIRGFSDSGGLISYPNQEDFPAPPELPVGTPYRLYADVWERTVSALEDQQLIDPGLHGADTCTRTQTMAQIKCCPTGINPEAAQQNPEIGNALLTLAMRSASTAGDPCDPCATVVDITTRTGNYLMRIEVHDVRYVDDLPEKGVKDFVLKWSSENGAEQYAVGFESDTFKQQKRVYEFFNESSEKHSGVHLCAGDHHALGKLTSGYPATAPGGNAFVRRWDGFCKIDVEGSSLKGGEERGVSLSTDSATGSIGHVSFAANLTINLTAMALSLEIDNRQMVAGDFWLGTVRENLENPDTLLPSHELPQGIRHHYMALAEVDEHGNVSPCADSSCKRIEFPPLTDIHATDVCVDDLCKELYGDAKTVQDALEQLCRQKGLKYHNKHLHGWGIVCGLQLECMQSDREYVYVQKGSAIQCDGTDLEVKHAKPYPVIDIIRRLEESNSIGFLNQKGDGDLSVSLEGMDESNQPVFKIEPYRPGQGGWKELISDTLLLDFYNDCIREPFEIIRDLLTPQNGEQGLVKASDERLITVLNLLIQLKDPTNGQYVYLSPKEDKILRELYGLLREMLSSETYCAMFDGLPGFPEYPFSDTRFSTVFGPINKWRMHDRLRVHPSGELGYTIGGEDHNIHVFHLKKEVMIAEIPHPGGENCIVQDVAFSPDGKLIYASALLDSKTVLAVGRLNGPRVEWDGSKILCDLQLVRLATSRSKPLSVYAIAKGKGLYEIDPTADLVEPQQIEACNAVGHLIIAQQEHVEVEMAYITVGGIASQAERYNEVRAVPLKQNANLQPIRFKWDNFDTEGEDDIAVAFDREKQLAFLYVVIGLSNQTRGKQLLKFSASKSELVAEPIKLEDTDIRLAYLQSVSQLLITFADSYKMARLDVSSNRIVLPHHPVQIAPLSVVAVGNRAYVLNSISDSISPIPAEEKEIDLQQLTEYRKKVLEAFSALTTGVIQYLKDCFCHHLLVKCPECNDDDKIYLGTVSIRNHQVYKVCNFSKRKYVKSFPIISYWMSILPLGGLLEKAVEMLCCFVIPDLFGKFGRKEQIVRGEEKPGRKIRHYAYMMQKADVSGAITSQGENMTMMSQLMSRAMVTGVEDSLIGARKGVSKTALTGQPIEIAQESLQQRGVTVTGVQEYRPQTGMKSIIDFARTPEYLKQGDKVTLYQQNGQVKYYAINQETTSNISIDPELETKIKAIDEQSDALKLELSGLVGQTSQVSDAVKVQADAMNILERRRVENATAIEAQMNTDFTEVETSINGLKEQKLVLESNVAGLKTQSDSLSELIDSQTESVKTLKADVDELSKARTKFTKQIKIERIGYTPVSRVTGVSAEWVIPLQGEGIRTTSDLAEARASVLMQKLDITNAKANKLIAMAREKMQG